MKKSKWKHPGEKYDDEMRKYGLPYYPFYNDRPKKKTIKQK